MNVKVLSAGAVKRGVAQIAKQYEADSGNAVSVEFDTAPSVRERLRNGEAAHVLVLPPAMLDELAREGRIDNAHRAHIGRSRMGLFVKRGAPLPDIATVDGFKRAILAADAIVYNTASSGLYMEQLLKKLELYAMVASRIIKVSSGAAVMEQVAAHAGNAVGAGQLSEIRVQLDKGVAIALAGPLPDEIQNATPYDAAATRGAERPAQALVAALTSDAAKQAFAATGID
ncbi:MAG: substrate-binding domain-containing protein [Rhodospirillaceae bacterium]